MPEYAELHETAHLCADAARNFVFTGATVDTRWSLPCSLKQKSGTEDGDTKATEEKSGTEDAAASLAQTTTPTIRTLPGTESWLHGFELCVHHRGKEVCIAARRCTAASHNLTTSSLPLLDSWCPTCVAVANDGEGTDAPTCAGHREPCRLQTVRRTDSKNVGKRFWSCCRSSARERCSHFRWASPSQQAKEADFFPATAAEATGLVLVTLRRGMHGRCVLLGAGDDEPTGVHLRFTRSDGAKLCFVDARVRMTSTGVWQFGLWGGPFRRSPDPVYEYAAFRQRALSLLDADAPPVSDGAAVLAAPACELLLDQRLFNGVGSMRWP